MCDEGELLRYCYRVAGTVGIMMCNALDVVDAAALPHAIDLGIGMQITNICRDVAEDAGAGRRYLPATLLGDIPPTDLIDPSNTVKRRLGACVETLLEHADAYYRSGEIGISYLPFSARAGVLSAARIYRAIGDEIRARDFKVWEGRAVVGSRSKCSLTAVATTHVLFGRLRSQDPMSHDRMLHRDLSGFPGFSRHGC
jgi:phytoene synthase